MSKTPEDRIKELTERNELLSDTLREARAALVEMKPALDAAAKAEAFGASLDYAIRAVDLRIREIDRSVVRGLVGTDKDGALRLDFPMICEAFEAALKAYGWEITRIPGCAS